LSRGSARRKVKTQTNAVVHTLRHELTSSGRSSPTAATHSVTQLRTTLQAVRQDVERFGAGRHTSLVKSALGDLDHSLQTMAHSFTVTDPNAKLQLLARVKQSLDQAEQKAKRAGHDWPL
jgi:hypothetical protein